MNVKKSDKRVLSALLKKIKLIESFLAGKFFKKKIPLFLGWDLTYRCNFNCRYCTIPQSNSGDELSTKQIYDGINLLHKLGTRRIHFGGGEVLLRKDLGEILKLCNDLGIYAVILTNGFLFKERLADIRHADLIKISLDGDEHVHDLLRQEGSFKKLLQAVDIAKKHKINIAFNSSLSTYNISQLDFILDFSKKSQVPVKFQVINEFFVKDKSITSIKLSKVQCRDVMMKLIKERKKNKYIINSESALEYMCNYPKAEETLCCAGKIYARISADGRLYPCQMKRELSSAMPYTEDNIKNIFESLPQVNCAACLCTTTLELNLIYSLKIKAVFNGLKKF